MLRQLITRIILSVSLTILLSAQADVYEQQEKTYAAYGQFLRSQIILIKSEFRRIPSLVKRISIVEKTKNKSKMPKRTRTLIAKRINDRIIAEERFKIIQCLECGSRKISITNNQLGFDSVLQNNESLRKKGRNLDIDAFLMWDAFIDGDRIVLTFDLVQTMDNQIIWSKQYSGPYDPSAYSHFNLDIYVGILGFDLERKSSDTNKANEKVDNIAKAGIRLRERFSAADRVEFSIGIEYFGPLANRSKFKFSGFAGEGRVVIDILPLMKHLKTNLYIAAGPAYYKNQFSVFFRYGIEIPFQRFGYISMGGQYMPKKELTFSSAENLSDTAEFGGTSYDLTLGIRL